jgi:hypothetical protein
VIWLSGFSNLLIIHGNKLQLHVGSRQLLLSLEFQGKRDEYVSQTPLSFQYADEVKIFHNTLYMDNTECL